MRKVLAVVLGLFICLLCGCTATDRGNELRYNTVYPLSTAEYQMAVNHKLAPLINELQPYANNETVTEAQAAQAVKRIDEVYNAISLLNPPKDKASYQATLLLNLQDLSDWLKSHYDSNVACPKKEFADILVMIENSFNVTVN